MAHDFDSSLKTHDLNEFSNAINKILNGEDTVFGLLSVVNNLNYIESSAEDRLREFKDYPPTDETDRNNYAHMLFSKRILEEIISKLNKVLAKEKDQFGEISDDTRDSLLEVADMLRNDPLQEWVSSINLELPSSIKDPSYSADINSPLAPFEAFIQGLEPSGSFKLSIHLPLTPLLLKNRIIPYIDAVIEVQKIIDDILGKQYKPITIKSISQGSVNVELSGGKEAIDLIRENSSKWRRDHNKEMAKLELDSKQAEIEKQKAEIREMESKTSRENVEREKITAEVAIMKAQAKKLQIENQQAELGLYRSRFELALEMISKLSPNLSDSDRLMFASRLLKPLEILTGDSFDIEEE
jgi:hypothetical protein